VNVARVFVLLSLAMLAACRRPSSRPSLEPGSYDRRALLEAIGSCALRTYRAFDVAAAELSSANTLEAQRKAFRRASDVWQEAEVMQFGPLGPTGTPGGRDLRDSIYAWPLVSHCAIDRAVATAAYRAADFRDTAPITMRGLGALEYLLFHEGPGNACDPTDSINREGTWQALSVDERTARRAEYVAVLAADLTVHSRSLVQRWEPTGGNFLGAFVDAGRGSKVYASVDVAINAVADALFYLEARTKDRKLGGPLGLGANPQCTTPPCGELLEARVSARSREHVRANLVALQKLVIGCDEAREGTGFDDYLTALSAGTVADELREDIAAAIAAVDGLPHASLEEAAAKRDVESLRAVYLSIKRVTDTLRTDFLSVLHLELPTPVTGDTD